MKKNKLIFIIQLLTDKLKDKIFIQFAIGKENPIKCEPISFIYVMLFLFVLLYCLGLCLYSLNYSIVQ